MNTTGKKFGGRQKGTRNKPKTALLEAIQELYPDYHPVLAMAGIANDVSLPDDMRFQAHKEVAQYVEPKRKAVEMQVEGQLGLSRIVVEYVDSKTTDSE